MKILLYGCDDDVELEQELPSSIISNFRLTEPSGLGRIAIGDMERLVVKDLLVGDGDMPYCKRTTLCRLEAEDWLVVGSEIVDGSSHLVGDGDEQTLLLGSETCSGLLNSSLFLNDQLSLSTSVRSS